MIELDDVEPAVAGPGEVLVRVTSCGLCGSDAAMFTGRHPVIRPPIIPGHEIIGRAVGGALDGRRVAVLPPVGCGHCPRCRAGDPRLCTEFRLIGGQLPGGIADEVVVPESAIVVIPDEVPDATVAITEPLAVARHAVARAGDVTGASVLVAGAGPIGLLVALVARASGAASVTVVDPVPARRTISEHLGLEVHEQQPGGDSGAEFDVAFDCVGGAEVPARLLGAVPPGGTLVVVGVAAPELTFDGMLLQRQERSILGSHMYTRADVEAALALLADGLLPVDEPTARLLFDRRGLDEVQQAFDDLVGRRSEALKILIEPGLRSSGTP